MAKLEKIFITASDKHVAASLVYAKAADHKLYYESAYTNQVTQADVQNEFKMGTLIVVNGTELIKPFAINGNIVKTLVKTGAGSDAFDAEDTYSVGALVTKDGKVYKCTTAISSAAAWDASKWTEVTSAEIVEWAAAAPANS